MSNQKTYLVTGGCGFIGSHLVEELLAQNHKVIIIDNCSTGRQENIKDFCNNTNLVFHQVDIRDYEAIKPLFHGVYGVFHLAALADIVPSIEQPDAYFTTNVDGTYNVLKAANAAGVKRFIYSASSSCYGIPDQYPTDEQAEIRPQYPYALTKRLGEELVMHWALVYNLPCLALRFFNVYGPRSRTSGTYGAVFGVFLAQKLANKPYTVVGDGTQTRDFTFVTDIVSAILTAANSSISGEIFNVGSGNTYSVNRLVELLGGDVVYIPKRPGEPDCTFADTTKINKMLHWQPKVTLEEGVKVMLDNIDYWREATVWDQDSIAKATQTWFKYLAKDDIDVTV